MKPKFILIAALILIHLTAYSETEPNNNMQQANNLLYNGSETGTLTGTDAEDWFVINIPQGGVFNINVKKTGAGNGTLYLYDGEKTGNPGINSFYLSFVDSPVAGWNITVPLLSGKYYVKIVKEYDPVNYQLTASLVSPAFTEDTEPNDTVSKALVMPLNGSVSGNLHYYDAGKGTDVRDWYKIDITQAGILTLKINKKGPGNCWIVFRDGKLPVLPKISDFYIDYMESPANGWNWSYPVLAGTYYFSIEGGDYVVDYKLDVSLTSPAFSEDKEPNDTVTKAVIMPVNGSVSGNVHYYINGKGFDIQDWYKIEVLQGGILNLKIYKKGPGNTWLRFRDGTKSGLTEITNFYMDYWESPAEGWNWSYPVLKGTYYFQVDGGANVLDYKIETKFTLPTFKEDVEPNDSLNVTRTYQLNDSVTGLLGYYKPGYGIDNWDWYTITIVEYGNLSFRIDKKGFNNGYLHLRDSLKEILFQYLTNNDLSLTIAKLLPAGKYYLGFEKVGGDLQYKAAMKFTPKPKAEFSVVKTDHFFTFENKSTFGETYEWNFDDGAKSTAVNPSHEFLKPGNYYVSLIAKNISGNDTVPHLQIIPGIDRIFPGQGGNTGDVTIEVFGGGLDTAFTATISKGTAIVSTSYFTGIPSKSSISVSFDLRNKSQGTFDLVIVKKGGPSYSITDGFRIVPGVKADPWVNISGRGRILFNTWTTYTVNYGNNGNIDAKMVPVWLSFSRSPGLEIEFVNSYFYDPDSTSTDLTQDGLFADLDSLFGQPKPVRVYPLLIPLIPAGSSKSFNIRIKTGGNLTINAWTEKPWYQSSINENKMECIADLENTRAEVNDPINENKMECIADAIAEAPSKFGMTDKVLCTKTLMLLLFQGVWDRYYEDMHNYTPGFTSIKEPEFFSTTIKCVLMAAKLCGLKSKEDREKISYWLMNNWVNNLIDINKTTSSATSALKVSDGMQCEAEFEPQNPQSMPLTAVSSLDPNEKAGPSGYGTENYISATKNIPYTIYFENKASATAPAHTVTITDQLDKTKFDLSSFSFGNISVGDSIVQPKPGLREFVLDKKLDKLKVVTRISGKLDTLTGKLEWKFRSLDPVTFDDIEDPDIGLLPPNKISPEGQGSVSFFVRLKVDPAHKSSVINQASIVFDANPAIITNKHLTTFDLATPQSAVQSLSATTSARQFNVKWSGSDDGSGIGGYNIYVKTNNGPYNIWLAGTTETSAIYKSPADGTFQFSSVAVDKTGNVETLSDNPDATTNVVTSVNEPGIPVPEVRVYPTPSTRELVVNIAMDGRFTLRVYATDGRLRMEKQLAGNSITNIQTGLLSRGLYLWQLMNEEASVKKSGKFVVNE